MIAAIYRAPLGCPNAAEYADYVASRSSLVRLEPLAALSDSPDRVRVQIRADPNSPGWIGELHIEGENPLEREVRGDSCQDVAVALALITVLRLEPERSAARTARTVPDAAPGASKGAVTTNTAPGAESVPPADANANPAAKVEASRGGSIETPPNAAAEPAPSAAATVGEPAPAASSESSPPEPSPAPTSPAPPTAAPDAASRAPGANATPEPSPPPAASPTFGQATPRENEATAPLTVRPSEAQPAPESAAPASREIREESRPEADVAPEARAEKAGAPLQLQPSLVAYVGYASAPSQAFAAAIGAELRLGPELESWAAALSLAYRQGAQRSSSGDLSLRVIAAEFALCPLTRALDARLWLRVCGELAGGAFSVSASERDIPLAANSTLRPWFALGPSAQFGVPLTPHFALRGSLRVSLALVRDRFEVERATDSPDNPGERFTLYRPPALSADVLLGAAYTF